MKQLLLILFFAAGWQLLSAQTISGILLDKQTGEALISAAVVIKGTTIGAQTDIDGKFELKITEKPPFTLVFSYVGYTSQEIEIKTETDLKRSFTIRLGVSETILDAVEIVDTRITEKQQQSPLTIESMGLQAIKQTASSTFYEGLGAQKGVDMTTASLGFVIINTRGFNSTRPVRSLQLLDGADNQSPGLNFSVGNFAGATEIDIQKVDLIVGASSPLYGPNAFNGVLSMQTKNPFYYQGLTVFVKGGERRLFEGALRYAKAFRNKYGTDKFAFKINFSYLRADDWVADNMAASTGSWRNETNPGGYDAVNRYGDELLTADANNYDVPYFNRLYPGLKQFFRTGYLEKDVVNYNVRNLKTNAYLHYKLTEKIEAKVGYNFGAGTTVYQGDNRYSLKDFTFHQVRFEISQPDKFFVRAYSTMENSGNSYDAVFTALKMQQATKADDRWASDYVSFWNNGQPGVPSPASRVRALPGFPNTNSSLWISKYDSINSVANAILNMYRDSLNAWHQLARNYADQTTDYGGSPRAVPGTPAFDSLFQQITSSTVFEEGGTRFYDKSKLVHVQGEYKFEPKKKGAEKPFMDIIAGASFRMFFPDSRGTIFSDTMVRNYARDTAGNILLDAQGKQIVLDSARKTIRNWEVGMYVSATKKFDFGKDNNHSIILTATCRVDKNQNFPFISTPAASLVYSFKNNHTVRVSYSSAIRNPTLQDQYLYYNVGRALLIGNLNGFDSLVTIESLRDYFNSSNPNDTQLVYLNVPKVRPEKVQMVEIGYKGIIAKKLFVDGSAYVNFYRYFLGYQIGATLQQIGVQKLPKQVYRVSANSPDRVMTYGVAVGFNYYFVRDYSLNGNYSWNKINMLGSTDPIVPAYNTPEHKFNVGISGYNVKIKNTRSLSFNVTYKWIQGFEFSGSPQFTGSIPTYSLLDAQVSWNFQKWYTTLKLGGSNLISKRNYQTYGGPGIGRMIYASILVDIGQETIDKGYEKIKTKW
ncbi:MAG: TonB-dependent receptor [Chitinophagales bacterium]|nr:TonB-dependent receptor [Chitinophagales bacterium]